MTIKAPRFSSIAEKSTSLNPSRTLINILKERTSAIRPTALVNFTFPAAIAAKLRRANIPIRVSIFDLILSKFTFSIDCKELIISQIAPPTPRIAKAEETPPRPPESFPSLLIAMTTAARPAAISPRMPSFAGIVSILIESSILSDPTKIAIEAEIPSTSAETLRLSAPGPASKSLSAFATAATPAAKSPRMVAAETSLSVSRRERTAMEAARIAIPSAIVLNASAFILVFIAEVKPLMAPEILPKRVLKAPTGPCKVFTTSLNRDTAVRICFIV